MFTENEKRQILEKVRLTRKEDLLRTIRGEDPESVQLINFGWDDWAGSSAYRIIGPNIFPGSIINGIKDGQRDAWGVPYACNAATNYAPIPAPGRTLLTCDDLPRWRDLVTVPRIPDDISWEKLAKSDWETSRIDHRESAACALIDIKPFQQLVALMGFEECFLAMYEEPEYVHEILDEIQALYKTIAENTIRYYTVDMVYLRDDTASKLSPFFSVEMYREFLLPVYREITAPYTNEGIPLQFHNCGKCEAFLDDMASFGVKLWDPAQTMNDLFGIQKRYGRNLFLCGAFDWVPPLEVSRIKRAETDEMIRSYVDRMTENAPFFAMGGGMAAAGDKAMQQVNSWMQEELFFYTRAYYTR